MDRTKDSNAIQDVEASQYHDNSYSMDTAPRVPVWSAAIGNPAPLGLLAFGMTTFFLMTVDTLWSSKVFVGQVIGYAYAYGGFAQMVAGVLEFLKGNTFAGSAFFSYGSFWVSWAFYQTMSRLHAPLGFTPDAGFKVGECVLLATWGFFTLGFFVPTLRKNGCLMTVFGSLTITFWLLAGGIYSPTCSQAAGYIGAFCGLSAIYAAFAELWHDNLGIILPGLHPVRFI